MKLKLFLLSLFMLFAITTNAQISATQAGIAVQGIARDTNNTAIASKSINLIFTLYYLDASSIEQLIFEKSENLTTDAFGIFSYVIDPTATNNSKFANNIAYLRIKNGSVLISDEKLHHVPYAIAANNGVPTGSIMPYIGATAPEGWALCDGRALPSTATALIALVGTNAPNLQGMFLRGTGTSPANGQAGPALKSVQGDAIKSHNLTVNDPGHAHNITDPGHTHPIFTSGNDSDGNYNDTGRDNNANHNTGNSKTGITINTATTGISVNYSGDSETRPVNYGVNYIIKL